MKTEAQFRTHLESWSSPPFFQFMGLVITEFGNGLCRGELAIRRPDFDGPPGFIHAGVIVSLADSCAGAGCEVNLPESAIGFTTIELKTNLLSSAGEGTLVCTATAPHMGRTTQVWDAEVSHKESGRTLALFRCTQMVLYPRLS